MFILSFPNLDEVQSHLAGIPDVLHAALLMKSQELADSLQQKVGEKLSGDVLQSKTGLLSNSVMSEVQETDAGVSTSVFVNGDVPYAAIQEYGGTTKAHIITALNGKMLAFSMDGKLMFAPQVNHPGSVIPEHSYLRSSLDEMSGHIADGMSSVFL
ncbi:MAG TPA: hypothetical protein VFT64_04460 [Rickettsiales bacterium]|nr:hypothetical protein [Rickettsiales bacterium]